MNIEAQKKEPYVTMKDGWVVHIINPKAHQMRVTDFAWQLARECRYNKQMECWYSNAEHSVLGSRLASSPRVAQYFLIHDGAEYAFGDLTSPVKRMLPIYQKMINSFQAFMWNHYCGEPISEAIAAEIESIDKRITATEMKYLRHQPDSDLGPFEPYKDLEFLCYEWRDAYDLYLKEFDKLFPGWLS